ncbi:MAG: hypothetical protein ACI8RZ_004990 [Myxococcota bacterium]|jgi:hypothetical protein
MYARPTTTDTDTTNIGELITIFFEHFMEMYGDADIASVATAAVINDLMADEPAEEILEVA